MGDQAPDGTFYTADERERFNTAFSFLSVQIVLNPEKEFSAYLIKTWHSIISKDVAKMLPGTFRTSQPTRFGSYKACPAGEVQDRIDLLVKRIRSVVDQLDGYITAKGLNEEALEFLINESSYLHAELVSIHPFMDGNGRISRLCQVWLLARFGLGYFPEFDNQDKYLSAINCYHDSNRQDYMTLAKLSKHLINAKINEMNNEDI